MFWLIFTPQEKGNMEKGKIMWRKPKMTEICIGAEINSYVSAARK